MLTKGAIGNLINRYRAVLKKCNLINTFGSLAVASMLVMGGAGVAGATAGDFSYITEGGPIYIGKNNIVSSSEDLTQNPDTFNKDNNQNIIITVNTNQGLSNPIKFKSGASIVTTGNINLNSAEGLEFGEGNSNTITGKDISISGKLDNDGTLNINAGNDFQLSNSHLCGDGTFNITAENDIFLSGDKKPVINTGANIALSAKNNVTITGTTIDSNLLDAKDFEEVLKLDGRKIAILFDEAHQSYTAGQNLNINGDVLFFNNGSLNLVAEKGNVEITGVVSNRPEAVADENYVKEVNISCGGSSSISGTNVTINGEVWNERSHDPEITMTINATDTLTIIGSVDNQSELNITAGSLIHTGGEKDGYLNFDGNNAITVTSNATIGDGNVAPIVAAGNLNFTAGGTAAINGGKVTDAEIIKYAPAVANRTLAILGATLETSPDTTQTFTAQTLQINGDIVATDRSTVALTATGDGSFITGNILTTDSAKVTMDGAFTMNGAIAENSKVTISSGSLTVDAATLGTVGNASAVTKGIQSSLTVNGATLILDLANIEGGNFVYTQDQFDAAYKALFGIDDTGNLLFANATLAGDNVEEEQEPTLAQKVSACIFNADGWTLSKDANSNIIFGGTVASQPGGEPLIDANGNKVGGNIAPEKTPSAVITITGGTFYGELNAGGLAVGSDSTAAVGDVTIDIKGGIISNTEDNDYSVIRGGGVAEEGGTVNVDKATITLYNGADVVNWNEDSEAGEGGSTDVYGGGVAMSSDSTAYTGIANITVEDGFDLRGVTVYGGGDGADVGTAKILIENAASITSHNGFEMYGGGHADEVKGASVNKATITVKGDRYANTFVAPEMPGAIYGGGRAKNGKTSRVDETTIDIQGGKLSNTDIYAGGFALPPAPSQEDSSDAESQNDSTQTPPVGITQTGKATIKVSNAIVRNIYGFGREVDSFDYYKDKSFDSETKREACLTNTVESVDVTLSGSTDVLGDVKIGGNIGSDRTQGVSSVSINGKVNVGGGIEVYANKSSFTVATGADVDVKDEIRAKGHNSSISVVGKLHTHHDLTAGGDNAAFASVKLTGETTVGRRLRARGGESTIDISGTTIVSKDGGGASIIAGRIAGTNVADTSEASINISGNTTVEGDIFAYGDNVNVTIAGNTNVGGNVELGHKDNQSVAVNVNTNEFILGGKLRGNGTNTVLNLGEQVADFSDSFRGISSMNVTGTTTLRKADGSVGSFYADDKDTNMTHDLTLSGGGELIADIEGIEKKLTVTEGTTLNAQNIKLSTTQGKEGSLVVDSSSTLKTTAASVFTNQANDVRYQIENVINLITKGQPDIHIVNAFDINGTLIITDRVDAQGDVVTYELSHLTELNKLLTNGKIALLATLDSGTTGELALDDNTGISNVGNIEADNVTITGTEVSIAGDVVAKSTGETSKVTVGDKGSVKFDKKEKDKNSNENENSNKGKNSNKVGSIHLTHETSKAHVHTDVATDTLVGTQGAIVYVGDNSTAGSLSSEEADLNGAHMFLDPVWKDSNDISEASKAALGGDTVDGLLTVGQNSVLTLGTAETSWAEKAFNGSGLTWGNGENQVTAALAIVTPQTLEVRTGGIKVDGSLHQGNVSGNYAAAGNAIFAANSLLMVEGSAASGGNVALTGTGTLTVHEDSILYIHNAEADTYTITDGFTGGSGSWNSIELNPTVEVSSTERADGKITVTTRLVDIRATYPTIVAANNINAKSSGDKDAAGVKFLSKALEQKTGLADVQGVLDDAARGAVTAGVQNTALRVADAASNVVLDHMSLAQHDGSRAIHSDGVDFWAAPMYGNLYTSGMLASGASVRGQFGGLALGADMEAANVYGGKLRVGAAINGGGGQSESKGSAMQTQNDYGFGGLNLYAGWNRGVFNVIGSVGYSFGDHDIEMSEAHMGTLKGNVDTQAFTADLRAEYQLATGWLDVLPHVGVRYTALKTGSHSLKLDGSTVNSLASDTQHIMQFPVGVTLSRDFEMAGWNVKPSADVSFIPAAGDKDTEGSVRFSGVNASDSFDSRVMDSTSWAGTVGVQAEKGDFTLGLNYGVQTSSHETDQNVQLKLGWKF